MERNTSLFSMDLVRRVTSPAPGDEDNISACVRRLQLQSFRGEQKSNSVAGFFVCFQAGKAICFLILN